MNNVKTILLTACLICLLSACTAAQPEPTAIPLPANTDTPVPASSTPSLEPTLTLSPTPQDTLTPLPDLRQSPMTLMLSRPTVNFDSIAFLEEFITLMQDEKMQVLTYRDLSEQPDLTGTQHEKLIIITIDNIYLRYPIHKDVLQLIEMLKEAGYPAVLSIITEDDYIESQTLATLKELSGLGWEIASNTDTYRNLLEVQGVSPKTVYPEIDTSLTKLEHALGQRPITLMLPYGQMTYGDEQIKRTGVQWVVGINGGIEYKISAAYYYVGREGAAGTAAETFERMKQRFGN